MNILVNAITKDYGGIESFFLKIIEQITTDEVKFTFLCPSDFAVGEKEIIKKGNEVVYITRPGENLNKYYNKLKQLMQSGKYDIYHTNLTRYKIPLDVILAKKNKLKIITHSHSTQVYKAKNWHQHILRTLEHKIFKNSYLKRSDLLLACSENAGLFLFGKKEFKILYNGIDIFKYNWDESERNKRRKEFNVKEDEFLIGHIGRFSDEKNHIFLIKILESLIKKKIKTKLILIGDGPLKESIVEEVNKRKIGDYVIFTGVRTDVPLLLPAMDVFAFPSKHEAFPISIIEAQVSGLKCYISDNITREIEISNRIVFLKNNNLKLWTKKIKNECNKKRQQAIITEEMKELHIEFIAKELVNYYKEILSGADT